MSEVTGREMHRYTIHEQQRVADTRLKGHMDTLRVFIRFCEQINAVEHDVVDSELGKEKNVERIRQGLPD